MALLMLLVSTGFSIDFHFCQGQLKSFSLVGEAASCHNEDKESTCAQGKMACHATSMANQGESGTCDKGCCSNIQFELSSIDETDQKIVIETSVLPSNKALSAIIPTTILWLGALSKHIHPYLNYRPPILDKQIILLIQSFLL